MRIIFSLVLYNQKISELKPLFQSLLELNNFFSNFKFDNSLELYITDNGDRTKKDVEQINQLNENFKCNYIKSKKNLGFGRGHNNNLLNILQSSGKDIFVIVNPDISFLANQINPAFELMKKEKNVICLAPLIMNSLNSIQYSVKKNPTFFSLLIGRFSFLIKLPLLKKYMRKFMNQHYDYETQIIESTYLSGCFLIIKSWAYLKLKGFDENYFLHLEDADIVRRLAQLGKTIHYPFAMVTHRWARGSHRSFRQMLHLIRSMVTYFRIWGFKLF